MSEINIKNASDEELEEILRLALNTHVDGSEFQRAQIELDIRRKRKLYELQEKTYSAIKIKVDEIIRLLNQISKKPKTTLFLAASGAIAIGVLINLFSTIILRFLGFK
jgi:hypothetical protein